MPDLPPPNASAIDALLAEAKQEATQEVTREATQQEGSAQQPDELLLPLAPLERLLDPAHARQLWATPLQSQGTLGLNLPTWNALQTYRYAEVLEGEAGRTLELPPQVFQTQELSPLKLPHKRRPAQMPRAVVQFSEAPSEAAAPGETLPIEADPFLDDALIQELVQALYDALPEEQPPETPPETTSPAAVSEPKPGNRLGRYLNTPVFTRPSRRNQNLGEHFAESEAARILQSATPAPTDPLTPRQYVRGTVSEELLQVTRRSLNQLPLDLPAENVPALGAKAILGHGEACFLRAQSALWAWRTHRQQHLELHTEGPPIEGRNVLIEQKIGPVTLLVGCRVTEVIDGKGVWGFTLGSLRGQVFRSRESFLVERLDTDEVVFTFQTQQQIALANMAFLAPVHSAVKRVMAQGYAQNLIDLSASALATWDEEDE